MHGFKYGDRVRVRDGYTKYKGQLCGAEGRITCAYFEAKTVAVEIPGMFNSLSATGRYWVDVRYLEKITTTEEEKPPMIKGYTAATVKFLSGSNTDRAYFYACYDPCIEPGDIVVLSTAHHGLALGRVEATCSPASYVTDNREIVCRVELAAYNQRKEAAKKMAELTAAMDEMVKEYQATALYEMVAEKNPAMRQLLDSFRAVSGVNYPGAVNNTAEEAK